MYGIDNYGAASDFAAARQDFHEARQETGEARQDFAQARQQFAGMAAELDTERVVGEPFQASQGGPGGVRVGRVFQVEEAVGPRPAGGDRQGRVGGAVRGQHDDVGTLHATILSTEPVRAQRESRRRLFLQNVRKIPFHKVGEHEAVVQLGSPPCQAGRGVGRAPEACYQRSQKQLLREAHALVRWHLERAQLEKSQPASGAVRRI